jgi:hypothetical protein
MIRRSVRSTTTALLLVVLGTLNTGLPSHSHEPDECRACGNVAVSADVHSHGVILVDAAARVPATHVQLPALASRIDALPADPPARRVRTCDAAPLPPSERGPPPAAPRAPPQLV